MSGAVLTHDGAGEDGDEQADLRLGDAELGGHVGQQAGGQELARDRDEDGPGEHEQPEERETCALSASAVIQPRCWLSPLRWCA